MFTRNLKLTKSAPVSTPDTACYGRAPGVRSAEFEEDERDILPG
jgi:hypothetical protein